MVRSRRVGLALQWHVSAHMRKLLAPALRAIDRIHTDGALPRIPLVEYVPKGDADDLAGKYSYDRTDGTPFAVLVRDGPDAALTLVHEIGHFLDAAGIGTSRAFASETDARLTEWREAVRRSAVWRQYTRLLAGEPVAYTLPDGMKFERTIPVDDLAYATQFREYFARSYSQYIAVESGDATLMAHLHAMRARQTWVLHWDDGDFAAVHAALTDLFVALGWRAI